jgi:hypothetical protein
MEHRRKKNYRIRASPRYQDNDLWHFTMVKQYSRWRPICPFDCHSEWVRKHLWVTTRPLANTRMDRTELMEAPYPLQEGRC